MKIPSFWKAVELQFLHRQTVYIIYLELEMKELMAGTERERAVVLFPLKHYYISHFVHYVSMHATESDLMGAVETFFRLECKFG